MRARGKTSPAFKKGVKFGGLFLQGAAAKIYINSSDRATGGAPSFKVRAARTAVAIGARQGIKRGYKAYKKKRKGGKR